MLFETARIIHRPNNRRISLAHCTESRKKDSAQIPGGNFSFGEDDDPIQLVLSFPALTLYDTGPVITPGSLSTPRFLKETQLSFRRKNS